MKRVRPATRAVLWLVLSLMLSVSAEAEALSFDERTIDLAVNLLIGGVALGFAILHALVFLFHRRETGNLYFSLFAVALAANGCFDVLGRYGGLGDEAIRWLRSFNVAAAVLLLYSLVLFLCHVLEQRPRRWTLYFGGLGLLLIAFYTLTPLRFLFGAAYLLFLAWSIAAVLWLPLKAIRRRVEGTFFLVVAGTGWAILLGTEVVKQTRGLSLSGQALGFGIGALILLTGLSIFLARRIAEQSRALQSLNVELEVRVEERTRELRRSERKARQASAAKSDFLATMSHEIRTPMNAVIGLADMLADAELPHREKRMAATIRDSAGSLLAILNDILDLSRIETGGFELDMAPFSPASCVADAVELFAAQAAGKGIELGWREDNKVPDMLGDAMRIRQILVNLIGNAVKFTEQGEVAVELAVRQTGEHGHELLFSVRDSGIGIASERLEQLFQPFTQADASTTRRFGGTGLGLAICRRLVDRMSGRIEVESTPDEGSIFRVMIPAERVSRERAEDESPEPTEAFVVPRKKTAPTQILLAEDNQVNQTVVSMMLERLGTTADFAADGREVLSALERQAYDLILMDVHMPELDGLETARRIRSQDGGIPRDGSRQPYIIALTASALQEDRRRCLEAGMDDFLSKPVQLEALREALERGYEAIRGPTVEG